MGSSWSFDSAPVSTSTDLTPAQALKLPDLVTIAINGDDKDFYEFFGFERYSDLSSKQVMKAYKEHALRYHPDKCHGDQEEKNLYNYIFVMLTEAKETLMDRDRKEKYDLALKTRLGEPWSWMEWLRHNGRMLFSGSMVAAGVIAIGVSAAVTSGAVLGVVGSGLLAGGCYGAVMAIKAPDHPLKDFVVGVLATAILGAGVSVGVEMAIEYALSGLPAIALLADEAAFLAMAARTGYAVWTGFASRHLALEDASLLRHCDQIIGAKRRSDTYMTLTEPLHEHPKLIPLAVSNKLFEGVLERDREEIAEYKHNLDNSTSFDSLASLRAYTTPSKLHSFLNDSLKKDAPDCLCMLFSLIHNMKAEMKWKAKQTGWYRGSEPLWRGTQVAKQDVVSWAVEGAIFLNPSFMSSSKDRRVALTFCEKGKLNALIKIDCSGNCNPSRQGHTYALDIDDISYFPHEKEVLFYPYSGFHTLSCQKVSGERYTYYIELECLDTVSIECLTARGQPTFEFPSVADLRGA